MRNTAARLGISILWLTLGASACTGHPKAPPVQSSAHGSFEELITEVPRGFSDSKRWNQSKVCPEGSALTPFTRYDYDRGQKNHGFKHYFGRSCAIIESNEPETLIRKLASTATPDSVSLIPHGPFIWWYETGRRMEMGSFDHGTLSADFSRFEPDGSLAVKD